MLDNLGDFIVIYYIKFWFNLFMSYICSMKTVINYKKIKREILKRDTSLDSRFTTKSVKSKKTYSRKGFDVKDNL